MHRSGRVSGWLADLLLASVFYGHFRSEHLLVHHSYVGTVRDAATARFNEGFYQYFPRLLRDAFISALRAEAGRLAERGVAPWSPANPFWRYGALQGTWIAIALALGGIGGLMLFGLRALTAIWRQELANYIDHYGLTRKYLGDGTYEDVKPRHSWSAGRGASRGPFALHRETDHQDKPGGPSLMQAGRSEEPPLLPSGHLLMAPIAMIPPLWRRVMNPRVRAWRKQFYPEIADWVPYRDGTLPEPRPASADAR
jgi:alkane 1-monooxygenase